MADASDTPFTTPLDMVSSAVPDSALGPELSAQEEMDKRVSLVRRAIAAVNGIHEKLEMIERALGQVLPDVLREQAIGDSVDIISELNSAYQAVAGDGGSLKSVGKRISYAKEVTMPELLDLAKVKTFNTENFRVTKTTKVNASANPEAGVHTEGPFAGQPIGWDWLRDNGYESLIKPTVNASSLSAAAKELMENGMELPEDYFRVHTSSSISITKKAKKG